jgi:hypothetical protein
MDLILIVGSIFGVCIVAIAMMRKDDQKHPSNGKAIERTLSNER